MSGSRRAAVAALLALVVLLLPGVASAAGAADTTPPGPVTALTGTGAAGKITLRWKNPAAADLAGVLLVRRTGTTPPTSPTDGTQVTRVAKPAVTFADTLLDADTAYAYSAFAYDTSGNLSARATATARTAVQPPAQVRLSGTLAKSVVLTPAKARLFVLESLTVPTGTTLTLGAGSTTKVRSQLTVEGSLRSTGTAGAPAVVTSYYDDTVGGNTDGTTQPVQSNLQTLVLRSGGTVALVGAELRWGRLTNSDSTESAATATLTDSALLDFEVQLASTAGHTVTLTGNTFHRTNLYLAGLDKPVVRGNRFVDGKGLGFGLVTASPFYVTGIGDLAGIGANTATGTPAQRLFQIVSSTVRTSWTLQPASGYTYALSGVTVAPGGTLTAGPGSLVKAPSGDAVRVEGTLRSTGTADRPAVWTSLFDDTIGGDIAGTEDVPQNNQPTIALRSGGTLALTGAQLHWGRLWNVEATERPATATVSDSALLDFQVQFTSDPERTVTLTGNTFTRANLYLAAIDRPVVRGNRFVDGKALGFGLVTASPFYVTGIGDLAGIGANTATGTPAQRLFQFVSSTVRTSWTLQPASGYTYALSGVTVAPGGTLTAVPSSLVKAPSGDAVRIDGTLRSTGTADRPAVWTSLFDDTIGGDVAGTEDVPQNNQPTIALRSGGTLALTGAELHWGRLWNYDVGTDQTAAATLTSSRLLDFTVELAYSARQTAVLTGNTFTRANLYLASIDRPVIRSNRFVNGKGLGFGFATGSPFYVTGIGDLSGIAANRASGTAPQRVFQFVSSGVRGTWVLSPSSSNVHTLADVSVQPGGTMQVQSGALLKNAGAVRVLAGGTLSASGATFTSLGDDRVGGNSDGDSGSATWSGVDVLSGASASISDSTFTAASIALDVNGDWLTQGGGADVSVNGSQFSGNGFDIANGPKDEVDAVDAAGTFALLISSHEHGCTRPAPNQDFYTRTLWDVEGTGRVDDPPCRPGYVESDGH